MHFDALVAKVASLLPGSQDPRGTAIELLRFLKTAHSYPRSALSPPATVDELWHEVLLNTAVAQAVHAWVGGIVPHTTARANDTNREKVERRVRATAYMSRLGFRPDLSRWEGFVSVAQRDMTLGWLFLPAPGIVEDTERIARVVLRELGYSNVSCERAGSGWEVTCDGLRAVVLDTLNHKKRVRIVVRGDATWLEVKVAYEAKMGTPPDQQHIVCDGVAGRDDALVPMEDGDVTATMILGMSGC